jgi:hypothetical protein
VLEAVGVEYVQQQTVAYAAAAMGTSRVGTRLQMAETSARNSSHFTSRPLIIPEENLSAKTRFCGTDGASANTSRCSPRALASYPLFPVNRAPPHVLSHYYRLLQLCLLHHLLYHRNHRSRTAPMSSDNVTFTAPYAAVSSTDRGGQLVIVNIIGLTVALFSVALRVHISRRETENGFAFYKDDLLCFVAAVC